jgi:hypothetical protein
MMQTTRTILQNAVTKGPGGITGLGEKASRCSHSDTQKRIHGKEKATPTTATRCPRTRGALEVEGEASVAVSISKENGYQMIAFEVDSPETSTSLGLAQRLSDDRVRGGQS